MAAKPGDKFVREVVGRLADVRRERGVTQEALAAKLKIAPRNLQRIEAGQNLTLKTLWRIGRAFGVEVKIDFIARGRGADAARHRTK